MKPKHNITAIIYDKRGKVLSIGKNSYVKTHPEQKRYAEKVGLVHKEFLHAELAAIIKCRNMDKAHKIIVYRYTKDGKPALAKPCKSCHAAIIDSGIKVIEHT